MSIKDGGNVKAVSDVGSQNTTISKAGVHRDKHCFIGKYNYKGKQGKHKLILCNNCNKNKDSQLFEKESHICKVCFRSDNRSAKTCFNSRETIIGKRQLNIITFKDKIRIQDESKQEKDHIISDEMNNLDIERDVQYEDLVYQPSAMFESKNKRQKLEKKSLDIFKDKEMIKSQIHSLQIPHNLSLPEVVIENQGDRDHQAILKLRVLNSRLDQDDQVKVAELIDLLKMFPQEIVTFYLEQERSNIHGTLLANLTTMLSDLDDDIKTEILDGLQLQLNKKFKSNLANWICLNWQWLTDQTLSLIRCLNQASFQLEKANDIVTISLMVDISEQVTSFMQVTKIFSQYKFPFKLFLDLILQALQLNQQKLSFTQYLALLQQLELNDNQQFILINQEKLKQIPLVQWSDYITTSKAIVPIDDCESVTHHLKLLQAQYKPLARIYQQDLLLVDQRYSHIFKYAGIDSPNNLQFVIAQYAACSIKIYPKQLWQIGSGQGKSRIMNVIALILLLTVLPTSKVNLVFHSKHFMDRDINDFHNYWKLSGLLDSGRYSYHSDWDFQCQDGDIILCDEADIPMYNQSYKFKQFILKHNCICLTATPGTSDSQGIQRKVAESMGFKTFTIKQEVEKIENQDKKQCQILKVVSDKALLLSIQEMLKDQPVICYCTVDTMNFLKVQGQVFIYINEDQVVDDKFLRELDKVDHIVDGCYPLVIATSFYGMRGFDYRATLVGINLIIATPFATETDAMQGLCRVGRQKDAAKIFIVEGVDLVDKSKEVDFYANLIQFCNKTNQFNMITAKATPTNLIKKNTQSQDTMDKHFVPQRIQNMVGSSVKS